MRPFFFGECVAPCQVENIAARRKQAGSGTESNAIVNFRTRGQDSMAEKGGDFKGGVLGKTININGGAKGEETFKDANRQYALTRGRRMGGVGGKCGNVRGQGRAK